MMLRALRFLLLAVGSIIVFASIFVLYKRNDPNRLYFANVELAETELEKEKFVSGIEILDIAINLPVVVTHKNGNIWEITPNGVSYLASSPLPGAPGNSIMYGHNWGSILGNLHKAQKGMEVKVYFSDGSESEFEITGIAEVYPDDSSLLAQTTERKLTIYTCSGFFDEKRLVVTASAI